MSNTFTAQGLADFFQKVADGCEAQLKIDGEWSNLFVGGPSLGSSKDVWCIKPTKKVIDLSVLIESGIDVEGSNGMGIWFVDKLQTIRDPSPDSGKYECQVDAAYDKCQPRMNHKHAWPEGECPLPEGFAVKVWFRSGGHTVVTTRSGNYWGINGDTMCFEVLGVADGYVMPWEHDDE